MIRKNPRIRLTFLNFEKKCFNTFIKKLLERVPSPDAESILEKRTEECLTPQPTITNNFLPVDITHEKLREGFQKNKCKTLDIVQSFRYPPSPLKSLDILN